MAAELRRALHWVFKVGNLKKSMDFYATVFNMKVLRHEVCFVFFFGHHFFFSFLFCFVLFFLSSFCFFFVFSLQLLIGI